MDGKLSTAAWGSLGAASPENPEVWKMRGCFGIIFWQILQPSDVEDASTETPTTEEVTEELGGKQPDSVWCIRMFLGELAGVVGALGE